MEPSSVDLSTTRAQWIDRQTVVWEPVPPGPLFYALEYSPDASLRIEHGRLTGEHAIRMSPAGRLTGPRRPEFLHLAGRAAFRIEPSDRGHVGEALRSQLIATARAPDGRLIAATGVQLPGVLDDLYAAAAREVLGPSWADGVPRLAVWAPTARTVQLSLYDTIAGAASTLVPMQRDDATGVWSVTGLPSWRGKFYTYRVTVYAPSLRRIVTNEVTDPYSICLSADSARSQLADLDDPMLAPPGWSELSKPPAVRLDQASIYELHVRDFSAADPCVPGPLQGTYAAFVLTSSAGMRALRALAVDGLTHVQLMPVFDFAAVPERRADQVEPPRELAALPADSPEQQARIAKVKRRDAYDWGYDPVHYTVPEGSYSTNPDGWQRVIEFRAMVAALNGIGLRVVMDVVYSHSHAAGQHEGSVLDRIVPGYYQRLLDDGTVAAGTSCPGTAPEHLMMGKLVVDSVVTWARAYKIDGFRFDLMGFHPKANLLAVRDALHALTVPRDGVDGSSILLYGEGWNMGEVADDARFIQATRPNLTGTGIGTFNDRLRDAIRGGMPLDADPRTQGFGSGLYTDSNESGANGASEAQRDRLLGYQDVIRAGLTGDLRHHLAAGVVPGCSAEPGEAIAYADVHDNETLFDALTLKLPQRTTMTDRVRMQVLSLAIVLLSQGPAFLLAGSERLRSKSLDRNSYESGDWFNRLLWDSALGNGFGAGLPPAPDNGAYWRYDKPLLADPRLRPDAASIDAARERFGEFLRIRRSTRAFSLGSAAEIRHRVMFPQSAPGVIAMHIDTTGIDPQWASVIVVFNASRWTCTHRAPSTAEGQATLHPVQQASSDLVVRSSVCDTATGTLMIPPRTVAVFTQLAGKSEGNGMAQQP